MKRIAVSVHQVALKDANAIKRETLLASGMEVIRTNSRATKVLVSKLANDRFLIFLQILAYDAAK